MALKRGLFPFEFQERPEPNRVGVVTCSDLIPFGSWVVYEQVMKAATFEFIRAHPRLALETYVIYKPLITFNELRAFFKQLLKDLGLAKLAILILLAAAIGLFAPLRAAGSPVQRPPLLVGLVLLGLLCSMIPLIVAYPDDFLVSDPAYLSSTGLLFCLIWAVAGCIALVRREGLERAQASPTGK